MLNPTALLITDPDADLTGFTATVTPTLPGASPVTVSLGLPDADPASGVRRYPLAGSSLFDAISPGGAASVTVHADTAAGASPESDAVAIERSTALTAPVLAVE